MNGSPEAPFSLCELQTITLAYTNVYTSQFFIQPNVLRFCVVIYVKNIEQGTVMNPLYNKHKCHGFCTIFLYLNWLRQRPNNLLNYFHSIVHTKTKIPSFKKISALNIGTHVC